MNHWFLVGRDLLHIVWFVTPIAFAAISGMAAQEDEKPTVGLFLWAAVLVQGSLALGYIEGWNVR